MGAVAPPPHWIPEDDYLLKTAVEAGASLESLAKGAVQFSRRYTVQELQDRWISLLYDPDISIEASAHMLDFEHSALSQQVKSISMGSSKEKKMKLGKRKDESVRKCYYGMRKRICHTPFDMMDGQIPSGPGSSKFEHRNTFSSAELMIEDPVLYNFGNQEDSNLDTRHSLYSKYTTFATESTGISHNSLGTVHNIQDPFGGSSASEGFGHPCNSNIPLVDIVPKIVQLKEFPTCNLLEVDGLDDHGSKCSEFVSKPFRNFNRSSSLPDMRNLDTHSGRHTTGLSQDIDPVVANGSPEYGVAGSDLKSPLSCDDMQLIPPSMEDYFEELSNTLFDFSNEEELLFDKSYFNGFSTLLSESPQDIELHSVSLGEASVATCGGSISDVKRFGPEYHNGVICCTLNAEDLEIPSNDDVFLPFRFPSPPKALGDTPSSFKDFSTNQKQSGSSNWPEMNQNGLYKPSCMIKPLNSAKKVLNYPTGDRKVKFELPTSSIQHVGLRNALNIDGPFSMRSAKVDLKHVATGIVKGGPCLDKHSCGPDSLQPIQKDGTGSRNELESNITTSNSGALKSFISSQKTEVPVPVEKSQLSDQEEIWTEDDFDVPYFSDVEAMILDMDLSPDVFDLFANPEVVRFQHEQTKRTIIRLEQAASAHMERTIAAQGAFAVLYSRHTKHFIEKPEVLLGRATEDVKVDIDLGNEKDGGKISRRQAIIKMDSCGLFHVKNLGKCSIHVNGVEVISGQSQVLTSGCLLEVRGLAFAFETTGIRRR